MKWFTVMNDFLATFLTKCLSPCELINLLAPLNKWPQLLYQNTVSKSIYLFYG